MFSTIEEMWFKWQECTPLKKLYTGWVRIPDMLSVWDQSYDHYYQTTVIPSIENQFPCSVAQSVPNRVSLHPAASHVTWIDRSTCVVKNITCGLCHSHTTLANLLFCFNSEQNSPPPCYPQSKIDCDDPYDQRLQGTRALLFHLGLNWINK